MRKTQVSGRLMIARSGEAIRAQIAADRDRGQQGVAALDRQQVPVPGHGEIDRHHGPRHDGPDDQGEGGRRLAGSVLAHTEPNRRDQPVEYQRRPEDHAPVLATIKTHRRIGLARSQQAKTAEALDGEHLGLIGRRVEGVVREVDLLIFGQLETMLHLKVEALPDALAGEDLQSAATGPAAGRS